ncbi:MAG: hypothetical protein JWM43_1551 [Acidobacteriaceae bacterium]|nr:hypothetical protein [Acidobacteriaceae bacterium]
MDTHLPSQALRGILARTVAALCLTLCVPSLYQTASAQTPADKPAPDVLVFTNGDQLTGKLIRGVGDSVVFSSDMAGEITVPLAKVKELRSVSNFAVLRKNAPVNKTVVPAGTIHIEDNAVAVSTSNAEPRTIPDAEVGYIVDAATYTKEVAGHHSFRDGWNGAITAGATLIRSTQAGSNFNLDIAAVRNMPTVAYLPKRNRTIFNVAETYGKLSQPVIPQTNPRTPDSVAKTNIFHADLEQDQYFTPRFYALAITSFDHNFSQGLDLQQLYGAGFGWTIIQSAIQQLDVTANIHYEKQAFQISSNNQNLIGATIGDSYMRHLPGKLLFTQSASFLPAFNNSNAYSATFAAGLALPVYHRLSVSFNTSDNFLNNPSPGYQKNSYQFVTGITYTMH